MIKAAGTSGLQKSALLYLLQLALHGAGYELHGVRGWAHLRDIEAGTGRALWDQLPPLYHRRHLDRHDARDPTRAGPVWLYRITSGGARAVQEFFGSTCSELPGDGARDPNPGVYLPAPHRAALLLLRGAQRDLAMPIRFGERGWLTARELACWADVPNSAHASLSFLHRKRLVESRVEPAPAAERPARAYYRATELGHSLALLEWKPMPDVPRAGAPLGAG